MPDKFSPLFEEQPIPEEMLFGRRQGRAYPEFMGKAVVRKDSVDAESAFYPRSFRRQTGYIHPELTPIQSSSLILESVFANWMRFRYWPIADFRGRIIYGTPLLTIFVDNDNIPGYNLPSGSLLSDSQRDVLLNVYEDLAASQRTPDLKQGGLATVITAFNISADTHTYYFYHRIRHIPMGAGTGET